MRTLRNICKYLSVLLTVTASLITCTEAPAHVCVNICRRRLLAVKWPCCHSSLHLLPWGWTAERKEKVKDIERGRGEREKESAWDRKSVTKASHWFWDGELMKPLPDMTVQCQTRKSYAGCRALAAISLQIVCVCGWQKKKQDELKRHSFKKKEEEKKRRKPIFRCVFDITVAANGSFQSKTFGVSSYLAQTVFHFWWVTAMINHASVWRTCAIWHHQSLFRLVPKKKKKIRLK